ncbi:MAG: DNA mismatch repair protein MutS [Lachnospiraceae bacterium]|nr:DNA mismatch repair protein MutS [Lachnospiraceae bacterium]
MIDVNKEQLSPMMQKYMETKEQYKDCILFYRLGDFYEMFFDDAILASKELELTLTGKNCGLVERAPMCGVPFHACEVYLNKLVANGHKVAICEQVEDAKNAKGLVKREVIRIATPGTNIDMASLEEGKNNYIMSVVYIADSFGIAIADITTGRFLVTEVTSVPKLLDEIYKFSPSEIICNESFLFSGVDTEELKYKLNVTVYSLESWYFESEQCEDIIKSHFKVNAINGLGLDDIDFGRIAVGSLLKYLYETQKNSLTNLNTITPYNISNYMIIDSSTRRNLELTETMRDKNKRGSLLWVLDKCKTAMGSRMLRSYIEQPLIKKSEINERLDAVESLKKSAITREELREYLNPIYDIERLMGKISYKSANPRDLIAFANSLEMLPAIKQQLSDFKKGILANLYDELDPLEDIYSLINKSINEEAPITIKEGGIIKSGYNANIDSLRNAKIEGKTWLAELEAEDKERTGIKNLRIKYNKVFGYYFEVTNSYKDLVPADYIRKQTLSNAERYTTDKLKELEDTILNAEDKLFALEYDMFCDIRDSIADNVLRIQKTARVIACLDALLSLANVAEINHYVRPKINEKGVIEIKGGRHPVIEKMIQDGMFIKNDTFLDNNKNRISIITGPNMAGKSTYMRQTSLIVLMAQLGSFVPADSADIGVCDRIFTRVGASDDLASGQSTFMVEMAEVANILRNATENSLLILDEIGRGTSTFDGLSIAWAVVEYISNTKLLGAKTLFATHYHELTELEGKLPCVNNYCIAVKEQGEDVVFLRKIVKGGADKSYGIAVAKLAGVPDTVTKRAEEIVSQLLENDISVKIQSIAAESYDNNGKKSKVRRLDEVDMNQMSLFDTITDDDILDEIKNLDVNALTPIEALNTLYSLQSKLNNRW